MCRTEGPSDRRGNMRLQVANSQLRKCSRLRQTSCNMKSGQCATPDRMVLQLNMRPSTSIGYKLPKSGTPTNIIQVYKANVASQEVPVSLANSDSSLWSSTAKAGKYAITDLWPNGKALTSNFPPTKHGFCDQHQIEREHKPQSCVGECEKSTFESWLVQYFCTGLCLRK